MNTEIPYGTRVRIKPGDHDLPAGYSGNREFIALDPTQYKMLGTLAPVTPTGGDVLICVDGGWPAVRLAEPGAQVSTEVRLWSVTRGRVEPLDPINGAAETVADAILGSDNPRLLVLDLIKQRDEATEGLAHLRRLHAKFRDEVRDLAIETAEDQGWCDSGLSDALEALGLEPVERSYVVDVTISQTVTRTVMATDADSAQEKVDNDLSVPSLLHDADPFAWETEVGDAKLA